MSFSIELYDKTNPSSIEAYAQKLLGMTFQDVLDENSVEMVGNINTKGELGQLLERAFFHYECNNSPEPDFREAGVELKVSPYKVNADGSFSAKERLVLTKIDYFALAQEKDFESSHLWNKAKLILLVYYLYQKEIAKRFDYEIRYAKLFSAPARDKAIIEHDYYVIQQKVKAGLAHELSEGDTLYLGACTKAATSADRTKQPFSTELAKPRAFSFKTSYMTYVLNNYIVPGKTTYEPILTEEVPDFEAGVKAKIDRYIGRTVDELCVEFDIDASSKPKSLEAILAYRMLGIKGNKAEEFQKANIAVKTIRIGQNGKIKESMSFPTFKFKELVKEEWETSTFGTYLEQTRFFFVVYRFNKDGVLEVKGCQFWNIPYNDLQVEVRSVWERTKQVLIDGLKIEYYGGKNHNNLPNASENRVSHVRPHAQNAQDTYELPDGRQYPKQCFWLNNSYILSQLADELK